MKQFTSSLIHLPESLAIVIHYCVVNIMFSFLFPLRLRREGTMAHNNSKTHNKISILLSFLKFYWPMYRAIYRPMCRPRYRPTSRPIYRPMSRPTCRTMYPPILNTIHRYIERYYLPIHRPILSTIILNDTRYYQPTYRPNGYYRSIYWRILDSIYQYISTDTIDRYYQPILDTIDWCIDDTRYYRPMYRPILEHLSTDRVSTDVSTNISTDINQYTRWK